jgi:hypothetical protein
MSCTFCGHALRQLLALLVLHVGEVEPLEPCGRARRREIAHTFQLSHIGEERAHPHFSIHAALFRQIADAVFRFDRGRSAQHRQLAAIRKQDRHDHAERRRFSGAVGPDEPVERPHRHREIEMVDGDRRTEGLRHAGERNRERHVGQVRFLR